MSTPAGRWSRCGSESTVFGRRLMDVDEAFVGPDLEVLARVLVLERRPDHAVHVLLGGQGHRSRRRVAPVRVAVSTISLAADSIAEGVVRLEADADLVLSGDGHGKLFSGCSRVVGSSVCRAGEHAPAGSALRPTSGRERGRTAALASPPRLGPAARTGSNCRIGLLTGVRAAAARTLGCYSMISVTTPRADRATTLADGEAQALIHGDRLDQLDLHRDVVSGHDHLRRPRGGEHTRDVGRAEVELRTVAREEGGVSVALLLLEHVDLGLELECEG